MSCSNNCQGCKCSSVESPPADSAVSRLLNRLPKPNAVLSIADFTALASSYSEFLHLYETSSPHLWVRQELAGIHSILEAYRLKLADALLKSASTGGVTDEEIRTSLLRAGLSEDRGDLKLYVQAVRSLLELQHVKSL